LQYFSSTAISFPQDGQYIKDLQIVVNVALTTVRTEQGAPGKALRINAVIIKNAVELVGVSPRRSESNLN
jgi:hypothetical protein